MDDEDEQRGFLKQLGELKRSFNLEEQRRRSQARQRQGKRNSKRRSSGTRSRRNSAEHPNARARRKATPNCRPQAVARSEPLPAIADEWLNDAIQRGVNGIKSEFTSHVRSYIDVEATTFDCAANADKNRFGDVQCADATRVRLRDGLGGDYIHASHVPADGDRRFICTQAPMPTTAGDFWRMCWQERCVAIVMLCRTVERGVVKSHQYWPARPDSVVEVDKFTVTSYERRTHRKGLYETHLKLTHGGEARRLQHFQYVDWPDKGVPRSPYELLFLRDQMLQLKGTVVVHCAAGIGRTGTLVAIDVALSRLTDRSPSARSAAVAAIVCDVRNCRMHSVQTVNQYIFIYQALVTYLLEAGHQERSGIAKFLKDCASATLAS